MRSDCPEMHVGAGPRGLGYLHGHLAAVAAAPAELAVVPVAPGPHGVVLREAQGLSVSTAAGNVDHPVALQRLHLRRGRGVTRVTGRGAPGTGLSEPSARSISTENRSLRRPRGTRQKTPSH